MNLILTIKNKVRKHTKVSSNLNIAQFIFFILIFGASAPATASTKNVQTIIMVDTSRSMATPGMDGNRSSLLVSKLFTDILPGRLTVIPIVGPSGRPELKSTKGAEIPCIEDPTIICTQVEPSNDWNMVAKDQQLGTLHRNTLGDPDFKKELPLHLNQNSIDRDFILSLHSAEGVFQSATGISSTNLYTSRTIDETFKKRLIWLFDGATDQLGHTQRLVDRLKNQGVEFDAVIFGNGDTQIANSLAIRSVQKVQNASQMMKAFADIFRSIIGAPYKLDAKIVDQPSFTMADNIEEAWIVVYGNIELSPTNLSHHNSDKIIYPNTQDSWPSAGAYQVFHLQNPLPGQWSIKTNNGMVNQDTNAAYAVIQRSSLSPKLVSPTTAMAGTEAAIVVGMFANNSTNPISDTALLNETHVFIELEGRTLTLKDDGKGADKKANDGLYSTNYTFLNAGEINANIRAINSILDKTISSHFQIQGFIEFSQQRQHLDLGEVQLSETVCKQLPIPRNQNAILNLNLKATDKLPAGHKLFLKADGQPWFPQSRNLPISSSTIFEACLETTDTAAVFQSDNTKWLHLQSDLSNEPQHGIYIHLTWHTIGLTWWQRWAWLIWTILSLLGVAVIALGFILPSRFPKGLSITFSPDLDDVIELMPQTLVSYPGTRIGFYRNARVFLHPNYLINGLKQNALAAIKSTGKNQFQLVPFHTYIQRQSINSEWENPLEQGTMLRPGDIWRLGQDGPYFSISYR